MTTTIKKLEEQYPDYMEQLGDDFLISYDSYAPFIAKIFERAKQINSKITFEQIKVKYDLLCVYYNFEKPNYADKKLIGAFGGYVEGVCECAMDLHKGEYPLAWFQRRKTGGGYNGSGVSFVITIPFFNKTELNNDFEPPLGYEWMPDRYRKIEFTDVYWDKGYRQWTGLSLSKQEYPALKLVKIEQ